MPVSLLGLEIHTIDDRDQPTPSYVHNIAHEVRTPLTIILGYANLLHSGDLGSVKPEQRAALEAIVKSSHSLWSLVERISVLLTAQTHTSVVLPLNLARTTTRVLKQHRQATTQAQQRVRVRFDPDLPQIFGDPYLVEQAIHCLVENAIKFTPRGGRIVVDVYRNGPFACVAVEDTGIGIPHDQLENIFEPFYQVDDSSTRRYGGCGLGLAVVQAVADEHGGRVEVMSQPEQGSRFEFKLPLTPASRR